MKTTRILGMFAVFLVILFPTLGFSRIIHPPLASPALNSFAIQQQTTPTPIVQDKSVIGSTNGILAMGMVIVVIVTLPLLLRNKIIRSK